MSKKSEEYFVSLEPDGGVGTRCYLAGSTEVEGDLVALTREEITVLNYFDGKIFQIIDKFAKAGFDLGQKTALKDNESSLKITQLGLRACMELVNGSGNWGISALFAFAIENLELTDDECGALNDMYYTNGHELWSEFIRKNTPDNDSFRNFLKAKLVTLGLRK